MEQRGLQSADTFRLWTALPLTSSHDILPFFSSEEAEPEESEEPFVAPAGLLIPPDVELVSESMSR